MIGTIPTDKDGKVTISPSGYKPSSEVIDLTKDIKLDYQLGYDNQHRPYREFNDRSLLQVIDDDQKLYNTYTPPKSPDPKVAWRWEGVRPHTRNKIISLAAHLTSQIPYPKVFAQNRDDEEDRDAASVMKELLMYNAECSDYEMTMLFATIAGLVNPAVILEARYEIVLQEIKERAENGKITKKQVVDEVLSGFKSCLVPVDELLIENMYENDIQRQRFLIRRRLISFQMAKARYGNKSQFAYVKPGIINVFDTGTDSFYEVANTEIENLVEEVIYYNRTDDMEIPYVNGIYMGEENVEANLMKHRRLTLDVKGDVVSVPIYPYAKSGHEPIDEKRFFYYKSAVSKLLWDQKLIDRVWQMVVDGTFLSIIKPIITTGAGKIDDSVIFPGQVTSLPPNATVTPLDIQSNLSSGYNLISSTKESLDESSQDTLRQGVQPSGNPTAFELSRVEQNARIQLGLFGKMLAKLIQDYGYLMVDCIVQHQTTDQMMEILSPGQSAKLKTFITRREEQGKKITKKIVFTDEYADKELNDDDMKKEQYKLMEEEGGYDSSTRIYKVNPYSFARMKYLIVVNADTVLPRGEAFEKAMKLEAYDRMIANPLVDAEAVTRDFLVDVYAKGDTDKYMKQMSAMNQVFNPQINQGQAAPATGAPSLTESVNKQMSGSNKPGASM